MRCSRRSPTSRTRRPSSRPRSRKALAIAPELRRGLPRRRRAGGAQLPLRRSRGADAPRRWRSIRRTRAILADLGMHLLRTGDEPGARGALERVVQDRSVRRRHLQPAADDGHARQVRDRRATATSSCGWTRTKRRCCRTTRCRWRTRRSSTLSKRYQFTPKGPILIEMFPKHDDFAVRNVGLPGHDRRARRLLRPRRDDGFAAARRRASSSGRRRSGTSWRTSSRCRCRTSGCRAG